MSHDVPEDLVAMTTLYNETVKQYSQLKNMRLNRHPVFNLLFMDFLQNGGYENYSENDKTVQKHRAGYG